MATAWDLQHDRFVLAIAAVKDDSELAAGMHRDVDGKIADEKLPARRTEGPLVRQTNCTVFLNARHVSNRTAPSRLFGCLNAAATGQGEQGE